MRPALKKITASGTFATGPTLRDIAAAGVLYIDHRGLTNVFPEETLVAYRDSLAAGAVCVEVDVQKLSDGQLVIMHDDTVDRTTTSTGAVSSFDSAGWQGLVVDAGTFLGGGWGNERAPFLFEIIEQFGRSRPAILVIEIKSSGDGTAQALLKMMQARKIDRRRTLVNCFADADLVPFMNDGWTVCRNYGGGAYTGTPTPAQIVALGYPWVAVAAGTATAQTDALRAAGLKVAIYTLNSKYEIAPYLGHVDAVYSDDAVYLRGSAKRTTDFFASQKWYHGQQKSNSSGDGGGRGAFYAPNLWGYNLSGANTWVGALQGWASPIGAAATLPAVTITFSVKFESVFSATRFGWMALMLTDEPFSIDTSPTPVAILGYAFIFRKDGTLSVFIKNAGDGSIVALVAPGVGTAIADGATATYKITVTATQLTLERTDIAPDGSIATVTNSAYRGAFLHAGVKGAFAKFSNITVTVP